MFHQSGGCCNGGQPMYFTKGELKLGVRDVCLDSIEGCDFYIGANQFDYYKNTQLILDITKGRGSSFSLEIPLGVRFIIQSKLFTEQELTQLEPMVPVESL